MLPGLLEAVGPAAAPHLAEPVSAEIPAPPSVEVPAAHPKPPPLPATPTALEAASDSEPSDELIAFAGEHSALEIISFSSEPVPFEDLMETLAHETTYAPDFDAAVHLDLPEAGPVEAKAAAAPEEFVEPIGA